MTATLYINGRFMTQNFSGVQRFAAELTLGLISLRADRLKVLVPSARVETEIPGAVKLGRLNGLAWEQMELPYFAAGGLLLNLGNTAPLLARRQIVVLHDAGVFTTPESYPWKLRLWYKRMQRILVLRRTPIVTVSQFARQEIIHNLHAKPEDISVVTEGADHISRIAADEGVLRNNGLERGKFVLAVGNLAAHKNLSALGLLPSSLAEKGLKLVITGGFGGRAFRELTSPSLPQPAAYIGRVSDKELKALYQAASCFVFPSRYEGFGLPVAEAMVCGCPVVAADIPVLRELFSPCASFCDPLSPYDIASKVLEVVDNEALGMRLRNAGLELTRTLTWRRSAEAMDAILYRYDEKRN
jgi:glycosyltransferase involved in cell wall biosynthesis